MAQRIPDKGSDSTPLGQKKPDISIDVLAFESGFNDRTTFYRVFKEMTGLSPIDFKKIGLTG